MTYRGKVKDGVIELESGVELPEGAAVQIELESKEASIGETTNPDPLYGRRRGSLFEVPLHDGGALLRPWTREELMDEMLDP